MIVIIIFCVVSIVRLRTSYRDLEATEAEMNEQKIAYLYMPSLVGMMEEEATGKLSDMGFYNCIVEYEMSELTEPGRVIRQSIPEHTTVGTDYEIKIWISQGK